MNQQNYTKQSAWTKFLFYINSWLTFHSEIRDRISKREERVILEIEGILGRTYTFPLIPPDEYPAHLARCILRSPISVKYEIFPIIGIPNDKPRKRTAVCLLTVAVAMIALLILLGLYGFNSGPGEGQFNLTSWNDTSNATSSPNPSSTFDLGHQVNTTTVTVLTPRGHPDGTGSMGPHPFDKLCSMNNTHTRKCLKPGTSMYEFLGLTPPADSPKCEISHTCPAASGDRVPMEIDYHVCLERRCGYNTGTIHDDLNDLKYVEQAKQVDAIMIKPHGGCANLDFTSWKTSPPDLSHVHALIFDINKHEDCSHVYKALASCNVPNLAVVVFRNAFITMRSVPSIAKLLGGEKIFAAVFNKTELCINCSRLFEGLDLRKFQVVHFQWTNFYAPHVVSISQYVLERASALKDWRSNVPLTISELERNLGDLKNLKTGEFSVDIEQYRGTATFNLLNTRLSKAKELTIHLNVTNKVPGDNTVIYLRGFSMLGPEIRKIHIFALSNDLRIDPNEEPSECWDLEIGYNEDSDTKILTCKRIGE